MKKPSKQTRTKIEELSSQEELAKKEISNDRLRLTKGGLRRMLEPCSCTLGSDTDCD